jgi:sugar phosphate isomerase/epimerase
MTTPDAVSTRRSFLKSLSLAAASIAATTPLAFAAPRAAVSGGVGMKLGTVTYNLAKDWDIETIIKNCAETGFSGVEARTTHAHGIEVSLNRNQRAEVRRRFADSPVALMGLGSAFDYHTPDQAKLRQDIEATKAYLVLSHDVGSGGIKVRPNALPPEVPVEKTLEQIGRSLGELGRFAADYGQEIRLEVHGRGTSLLPNIRRIMDVADHPLVGVCWNSNAADLEGDGFDHNFDLVSSKIQVVHIHDLYDSAYPYPQLFARLNAIGYTGYCLAEIQETSDPIRLMHYYRALWLAQQKIAG